MALSTMADLVAALPGQAAGLVKSPTLVANRWISTWTLGGEPGAGANPSSGMAGDIPTKATAGAIAFANPASALSYLGRMQAIGSAGSLLSIAVYDRLWQQSGIAVTTTTAQTVNSVALDRPDANGEGAELWLDVYAATGAGAATPTASYTDSGNATGLTATCIGYAASSAIRSAYPFQLASGSIGVKSVQSVTLGTSLTSGTVGLVLRRKLAMLHVAPSAVPVALDAIGLGLPRIYDSACLEFLVMSPTAGVTTVYGSLGIVQG